MRRYSDNRGRTTMARGKIISHTFFVLVNRLCPTVNILFRDERIAKIREHPRDANHGVCADKRLG